MADERAKSTSNPANQPAPEQPAAPGRKRRSLLSEFVEYLMENKKWWMIPIIVMVLLLALVLILAGTPAATFIYPLF